MACVYVGKLYAFQVEGGDPIECEPTIIGVDDDLGLVQADTRSKLKRGDYIEPAKYARGKRCVCLWYERRRKQYPNDLYWFNELDDAFVFAALDTRSSAPDRGGQARPRVVIQGPDVETCKNEPPGDFLCG